MNLKSSPAKWVVSLPRPEVVNLIGLRSIAVIGHAGWDKNPEHDIPYALCVSFEAVGQELRVYNLMAEAQIETVIEQEVEV